MNIPLTLAIGDYLSVREISTNEGIDLTVLGLSV